jgi:SAM-dependent methyltransferase
MMNYQRIYEYRFQGVDQRARQAVWNEIAAYVYEQMGRPTRLLDPAAGRCEFINAAPAAERWVVDEVSYLEAAPAKGVQVIEGDVLKVDLPAAYFDGIFVSNFLEHLSTQTQVADFLVKMYRSLRPGGRIAVLGPNFKYCAADYFDCADHTLALTHVAVAEHLYAAGFTLGKVAPRFLPFSFRGLLPPSPTLTRWYLRMPFAWSLLGQQFLVVGQKP